MVSKKPLQKKVDHAVLKTGTGLCGCVVEI